MKVASQMKPKSHCMRHAFTHPADEECPYCQLILLERAALAAKSTEQKEES